MIKKITVEDFNENTQYGSSVLFDFDCFEIVEGEGASEHYMILKALIENCPWHELTDDCVEIIEVDMLNIFPILTRYLRMLRETEDREQYGETLVKEIQWLFDRG